MIVTTTPHIEGRRVTAYLGLVTGEAILGANVFRDFFASVRDVVGGRAGAYERVLRTARDAAIEETGGRGARQGCGCRGRRRPGLRGDRQGGQHADGLGERYGGEAGLSADRATCSSLREASRKEDAMVEVDRQIYCAVSLRCRRCSSHPTGSGRSSFSSITR